jgi:hypothetical protein
MRFAACSYVLLVLFLMGCGTQNTLETGDLPSNPDSNAVSKVASEASTPKRDYPKLLGSMVPQEYDFAESEVGPIVAEGDLNADSLPDVVFLVQNLEEEMPKSLVLVAYQAPDGKFIRGESSGNFGPEPLTYLDPEFFSIQNQVLHINYQSMRWEIELKFRKEAKYGDLRLIGTESFSYGNAVGDGAGGTSTNFLTGQRIANYKHVDMETGIEKQMPERREVVSTQLVPLHGFNDDNVYQLQ